MNPWERHRPALIVLGVFLTLAFFLWVFGLRGFEAVRAGAERALAGLESKKKELFEGQTPLATAKREAQWANQRLEQALKAESEARLYRFKAAVEPEPGTSPSLFLATALYATETNFRTQIVRRDNINIVESAIPMTAREANASLGFAIPAEEHLLTPADVALTIRQLETLNRFRLLLNAAHDAVTAEAAAEAAARAGQGGAGEPVLAQPFDSIVELATQKIPPADVGSPRERFLREYRIQTTLRCSLPGLLKLLELVQTSEHFHIVRGLSLSPADEGNGESSAANPRRAVLERLPMTPVVDEAAGTRQMREVRRYVNYYDVSLELATLTEIPATEIQARARPEAGASTGPVRRGPRLH